MVGMEIVNIYDGQTGNWKLENEEKRLHGCTVDLMGFGSSE